MLLQWSRQRREEVRKLSATRRDRRRSHRGLGEAQHPPSMLPARVLGEGLTAPIASQISGESSERRKEVRKLSTARRDRRLHFSNRRRSDRRLREAQHPHAVNQLLHRARQRKRQALFFGGREHRFQHCDGGANCAVEPLCVALVRAGGCRHEGCCGGDLDGGEGWCRCLGEYHLQQ